MPFFPLDARKTAHDYPDSAPFGWYGERHSNALRRILTGGGWSVHDVINRPEIRQAVTEQWRLVRTMQRDREVDVYIRYLEYIEDLRLTASDARELGLPSAR